MYKNSQTTSTKCQYQAAVSNPKWWFDEKCSVVCRRRHVVMNVVLLITCSPWNLVATKNVDPYAESAIVNGASKYSPRLLYSWHWPSTNCIGGWLDPRTGLNRCGKSRHHRDAIPVPSSYTVCATPAHDENHNDTFYTCQSNFMFLIFSTHDLHEAMSADTVSSYFLDLCPDFPLFQLPS